MIDCFLSIVDWLIVKSLICPTIRGPVLSSESSENQKLKECFHSATWMEIFLILVTGGEFVFMIVRQVIQMYPVHCPPFLF